MSKTIKDMAMDFGWSKFDDGGRASAAFDFAEGAKAIVCDINAMLHEYKSPWRFRKMVKNYVEEKMKETH